MKKYLALLLALMLLLTACSQPAQTPSADAPANDSPVSAEEEIFVDEYEKDGVKVKAYYEGGKDGTLVRAEYTMPDGSTGDEHYNADGTFAYSIFHDADGSVYEDFFYPNGTLSKSIMTNPDGSYMENHFADNGYKDEETGYYVAGTMTYTKEVAADGTVVYEMTFDFRQEEDGSYWTIVNNDDGSVQESHFSAEGILIGDKYTDPNTGFHSETTYYENGNLLYTFHEDPEYGTRSETEYYPNGLPKKMSTTYTDSDAFHITEYYENGFLKYEHYMHEEGTGAEDKYNEAGYLTYSHLITLSGEEEYFGDEEGNLLKYVDNGTVSEGNAIPSWVVDGFRMMQEFTQERNAQMQSQHQMEE